MMYVDDSRGELHTQRREKLSRVCARNTSFLRSLDGEIGRRLGPTTRFGHDGWRAGFLPHHTTLCTNQTQKLSTACASLAANQCVVAHDPHSLKFIAACLPEMAFTSPPQALRWMIRSPQLLRVCRHPWFEGFYSIQQSEQTSADWKAATPQWLL